MARGLEEVAGYVMMTEEAGRVATADGATIAWTRRGPTAGADAPWLLFCPGLGMTQKGYAADAAWFAARGRHTLTLDWRGCGRSLPLPALSEDTFARGRMAADVIALLDALRVARVDLVGHSLGGVIGLEVVARAPARVRSLITFGTTYHLSLSLPAFAALALFIRLAGPERAATLAARTARSDHARPLIRNMLAALPTDVDLRIRRHIRTYDYREAARSWSGPILLIRGSEDREINRQLRSTLEALRSKSNFHQEQIVGAGHFTNLDKPAEVRAAIARFLERIDGGHLDATGL